MSVNTLRSARYQQALCCYHQRHVRPRTLQVRDLALRRFQSREGMNKLSPMREVPFRVMEEHRPGVFWLTDKDGMQVPNVWNIEHPNAPTKGPSNPRPPRETRPGGSHLPMYCITFCFYLSTFWFPCKFKNFFVWYLAGKGLAS